MKMSWMCPRSCQLFLLLILTSLSVGFLGAQATSQPDKEKPETKKATKHEESALSPKLLPKEPIKPAANDDELGKLKIARFNEVKEELQRLFIETGLTSGTPRVLSPKFELVFDAGKRLLEARLEISQNAKEELEIREEYIELLKISKDWIQLRVEKGQEESSLLHKARYFCLDAEIQLLKAKQKQKK
jgi:hypothetical protein